MRRIAILGTASGNGKTTLGRPWGGASVQPPELPEAASAAGAADEAPNEDEDLEMFRSWLQSLKK